MSIDRQLDEAALAIDEQFSDPAAAAADYRRFLKLVDEQEEPEGQEQPEPSTPAGARSPVGHPNPDGRPGLRGRPQADVQQSALRAATLTLGQRGDAGGQATGAAREKLAAELKRKYDSGASIRALAVETGRSYGFVHRMLSESGVTLRGRGGATRGRKASS